MKRPPEPSLSDSEEDPKAVARHHRSGGRSDPASGPNGDSDKVGRDLLFDGTRDGSPIAPPLGAGHVYLSGQRLHQVPLCSWPVHWRKSGRAAGAAPSGGPGRALPLAGRASTV